MAIRRDSRRGDGGRSGKRSGGAGNAGQRTGGPGRRPEVGGTRRGGARPAGRGTSQPAGRGRRAEMPTGDELERMEQEAETLYQGGDDGDMPTFLRRYARGEVGTGAAAGGGDDRERYAGYTSYGDDGDDGRPARNADRPARSPGRPARKIAGSSAVPISGRPKTAPARSGKPDGVTKPGAGKPTRGKPTLLNPDVVKPVREKLTREKSEGAFGDESRGAGRLQKVLAAAGLGSRRQCEELITAGRVEIDRRVATELGTRVDPFTQEIRVDGMVLARQKREYYALHKPKGFVTTASDPSGRPRVIDLIPSGGKHLFAVGRLDMSSEGLILITNDGDWAERITHPRYGVEKTYRVVVAGEPQRSTLAQLERGVYLAEGLARVKRVTMKKPGRKLSVLEMVLDEGKNREIRRVLAKVGHKVHRLIRVAVGSIRLGEMPVGAYRPLSREEIRGVVAEVVRNRIEQRAERGLGRRATRDTTTERRERGRPVQFSELREFQENESRQREREEAAALRGGRETNPREVDVRGPRVRRTGSSRPGPGGRKTGPAGRSTGSTRGRSGGADRRGPGRGRPDRGGSGRGSGGRGPGGGATGSSRGKTR